MKRSENLHTLTQPQAKTSGLLQPARIQLERSHALSGWKYVGLNFRYEMARLGLAVKQQRCCAIRWGGAAGSRLFLRPVTSTSHALSQVPDAL